MKCSSVTVDGIERDVYKDPIGVPGKASKQGRLKLVRNSTGVLETVRQTDAGEDLLVEVFRDGKLLVDQKFDDIRARAAL